MALRLDHRPDAPVDLRASDLGRSRWQARYARRVLALDAVLAVAAAATAAVARFGLDTHAVLAMRTMRVPYTALVAALACVWLVALAAGGAYDRRVLGAGPEEYRRVLRTSVVFLAVVATAAYLARSDLARGVVLLQLPLGTGFTLLGRRLARRTLHRRRATGRCLEDVVVVGTLEHVTDLVRRLRRTPHAGFRVMGAVVETGGLAIDVDGEPVPVLGSPANLDHVLANTQADALAVADTATLPHRALRQLAWQLEGTGVDLIVAPGLTDVAGPRISIRPVAGLPLLHVEEPQLSGGARLGKEVVDRTVSGAMLVFLAPLLAAIALAVRLTSPGPALFRQTRVGKDGRRFTLYKFRTMHRRAEAELIDLASRNHNDGVLFKIRDDPRRTPLGCWLRRFSLDELPQLWNVVRGDMALVGPRPPLPSEVERYEPHVERRLLVKPGLTGLWQVNGRADVCWDESVRLDLYYVENWSPTLDALILTKTLWAVLSGRGAY